MATFASRREFLYRAALVVAGCCLAILLGEFVLRQSGREPWQSPGVFLQSLYIPDPVLGWSSRPGRIFFPALIAGRADASYTVWTGGFRATSERRTERARRMVILGGSFAQGWAVSDEETFAWRLQERLPPFQVLNLGTGGYGSCQSLWALERYFDNGGRAEVVVYGYHWHHQYRNIAGHSWVKHMASVNSDQLAIPHCALDEDGSLARRPLEQYPNWPLRTRSALVTFATEQYSRWIRRGRLDRAKAVLRRSVLEMQRLAAEHAARFFLVPLTVKPADYPKFTAFLDENDVSHLDCLTPIPPERRAPDGHPGAGIHAEWSSCIGEHLALQFGIGDSTSVTEGSPEIDSRGRNRR